MIPPLAAPRTSVPIAAIVVAASTGGPDALRLLLLHLSADMRVPIVIIQHIPPDFIGPLARRLSEQTGLNVAEAADGTALQEGCVWIAPGESHLCFVRRRGELFLATHREEPVNSVRPSADVLFASAVDAFRGGVLGVVLTGMGQDGCAGAEAIVRAGGSVFVQDRESSIVWGMPGSVVRAGFAELVLPIAELSAAICRRVRYSLGQSSGEYLRCENRSGDNS